MEIEDIKAKIEQGLPGSQVHVDGDGHHFEATVVHPDFAGKSRIQQHRMVYQTLGESFQNGSLHALSLRTLTPEQAE